MTKVFNFGEDKRWIGLHGVESAEGIETLGIITMNPTCAPIGGEIQEPEEPAEPEEPPVVEPPVVVESVTEPVEEDSGAVTAIVVIVVMLLVLLGVVFLLLYIRKKRM